MSEEMLKDKEVAYWMREFAKCKALREPFERQWHINLAFFNGKQYSVWLPQNKPLSSQRLVEPAAPSHRVRLVCNKVKPIVRTEISKFTSAEPQFFVRPNTPEPADISSARVAEVIAEHLMDSLKFNHKRRQAAFWLSICGVAFMKATISGEEYDLNLAAPSPFHIFVPNLDEQDIQAQPYVMHGRGISRDKFKETYGVDVPESAGGSDSNLELKFLHSLNIRDSYSSSSGMIYVIEVWVKPCKNYPRGAMLVLANGNVSYVYRALQEEGGLPNIKNENGFSEADFPYEHGEFPFVKQDHIPTGGFYSTSIVDELIPLQMEYNRTRSQMVEAKNRMGKPMLTYTKGAIDPTKISSKPGLMIPVNPGFDPPRLLEQSPPNPMAIAEVDLIARDIDEVASQNEISKGRTPPGIEAASAIAYLQEENDSKLHLTVASIEQSVGDLGRQLLQLVQEFWDEEKLVAVVSKNSAFEAVQFKSADIKGNTDLRIEAGSMAPRSKAARQAFLTEWIKLGIITPEQGMKYLEMSETNQLWDEIQMDAKAAQRENRKMSMQVPQPIMTKQEMPNPVTGVPMMMDVPQLDPQTGEPQYQTHPINPWDNTDVHITEHRKFMVSQEYEFLEPVIKEAILLHFTLHQQAKLQEGILNGGPAGNSGASAEGNSFAG
jgi:hypothetical protein